MILLTNLAQFYLVQTYPNFKSIVHQLLRNNVLHLFLYLKNHKLEVCVNQDFIISLVPTNRLTSVSLKYIQKEF